VIHTPQQHMSQTILGAVRKGMWPYKPMHDMYLACSEVLAPKDDIGHGARDLPCFDVFLSNLHRIRDSHMRRSWSVSTRTAKSKISHTRTLCTGKMSPSGVRTRAVVCSPPPSPSSASILDGVLQMGTLAALAHPQSRRWESSWPLSILYLHSALLILTRAEAPVSIEHHLFRKCSGERDTLDRKAFGKARPSSNILY